MKLEDRCKLFVSELGIPITQFCRRIKLSRTALYSWYTGDLKLSQPTIERIEDYLSKYGF